MFGDGMGDDGMGAMSDDQHQGSIGESSCPRSAAVLDDQTHYSSFSLVGHHAKSK